MLSKSVPTSEVERAKQNLESLEIDVKKLDLKVRNLQIINNGKCYSEYRNRKIKETHA